MNEILRLFPQVVANKLNGQINGRWSELQEIRLRLFKPIELSFAHHVEWITHTHFLIDTRNYLLNQLSDHSLYRFENELKEGFITIEGGHRVGLAGKVTMKKSDIKGLQYITSFNIRIAQQVIDVAKPIIHHLSEHNRYLHTLIVGAPQTGKTTILRDLARLIGNGHSGMEAKKVAIIDERSEIAASKNGIPQFDVGIRTDVMDSCPKSIGMMMMIRSMSPNIVIVDEIGKKTDVQALLDVFHAGITIICTAHGSSISEVKKRFSLRNLFTESIFKRYIFLTYRPNKGFIYNVYDENDNLLTNQVGT